MRSEADLAFRKGTRVRTVALVVAALSTLWASACFAQEPVPVTRDPLQRKVRSQLQSFVRWLGNNDARGYVGEAGWPDDFRGDARRWNALARDWFDLALDKNLWVSTWATGEWWDDYRLSIYEATNEERGLDRANTQAPVLEDAARRGGSKIGINVNGGEFGSPISARESRFSNTSPGAYNTRYHYDSQATFNYLAARGVGHVRIPFRWERLQPRVGGRLDEREVARLRAAVGRAWQAGLRSILDVHNYGAYYLNRDGRGVRTPIGSRALPVSRFADLWRRVSNVFKGDKRVLMYALMAEPYGMPKTSGKSPAEVWETASQRAVTAIRKNHDRKLISVPGYGWDALQVFMSTHRRGWIEDPADNFVYEVHHYWDRDHSGDYTRSYEQEVDAARAAGW
jgi:aryl-phospho-beta-D-glucosidase BglC (GH1 family)